MRYNTRKNRIISLLSGTCLLLCLTGCNTSTATYENFVPDVSAESSIEPVGSTLNNESYEGEEATKEDAIETYSSADGLCTIEKKPSYYEVYLDYTGGDYGAVGRAYAETILKTDFNFGEIMEPYLYENINMAFPSINGDYSPVQDRIDDLIVNIPEDYKEELFGFAETLSQGETGFTEDGKVSYEEALLVSMVPDTLRGTSCNALSVWGEKTETGEKITSRTLEWTLGSENQMCLAHAVTHFKMPEDRNSYMTFSVLGMLDVLTIINDDGVMAGILDVGTGFDYYSEGKKCYTYELRYAVEHMSEARSVGEYMVGESKNFTYSHNIIITDKSDAFVAEDWVDDPEKVLEKYASTGEADEDDMGFSILRDADTPLMDGITWDNPDSLCVVNTFMTKDNIDNFTCVGNNFVRFTKFNTWVGEKEKLSLADVKGIVTRESTERIGRFQKLYSENVYQTIIYDYSTGNIDVVFTGTEGVEDHPAFVRVEE